MKLTQLNPRWVGAGGEGSYDKDHNPVPERHGVAITLDCPCGCEHPLCVMFTNPIDGGAKIDGRNTWQRTGDTFDNLTLTPSIQRVPINEGYCSWHGFITNGEIITCG